MVLLGDERNAYRVQVKTVLVFGRTTIKIRESGGGTPVRDFEFLTAKPGGPIPPSKFRRYLLDDRQNIAYRLWASVSANRDRSETLLTVGSEHLNWGAWWWMDRDLFISFGRSDYLCNRVDVYFIVMVGLCRIIRCIGVSSR